MGSIRKHGSVYWIRYSKHGRRIEENTYLSVYDEARDLLKKREGAVADGRPVSPKSNKLLFKDAAADVETDYEINKRATLGHLKRRYQLHVLPVLGDRRLVEIDATVIRGFVASRLRAGAANAEINRELATIKRAFRLAKQSGRYVGEPNDTVLGESRGNEPRGRGVSGQQSLNLYDKLKDSTAAKTGFLADLEDCELFVPGKDHYLAKLRGLSVPGPKGTTVALGTKRIADVTTADIDAAEKAYKASAKKGKAGGVVGVRKLLQTARHLFNWAIRKGHAASTPFRREGVTLISVKPGKARKRRLVGDEEDRLLAAADRDTKHRMIAQLETGCRPGEIRTLQWSEVRGNVLVILAEKAKDREERNVRITATLRKVLEERRNGPDGEPLAPSTYVFGNAVGELVSKEKAGELWRATCKAAGVADLTMHDLRRTFGSRFLEAGNDVHAVRDVLGHSSVTMTNTYLSTEEAQQAEAFERFEVAERRRKLRRVG